MMIGLIAATGLRIGELLALRWRNLDLAIGTLSVRESVFEGKTQQPKTQKARRTIPLGPHAIALLKEHRDRATRKSADDLVFPNRLGEPLRESKLLGRMLQPAAERAGLGRVTWHQFRHIHSSLLKDLRVPVKIAQEQLGHASISLPDPNSPMSAIACAFGDGSFRRRANRAAMAQWPNRSTTDGVSRCTHDCNCVHDDDGLASAGRRGALSV